MIAKFFKTALFWENKQINRYYPDSGDHFSGVTRSTECLGKSAAHSKVFVMFLAMPLMFANEPSIVSILYQL